MTSAETDPYDFGLLAPDRVGTETERATGDRAFLQAMLDAEAALTRAQSALGQAPARAAASVTEAAHADLYDPRDLALRARRSGNPVIPLVAALTDGVPPDVAPYVHRGATSQDILDTATMLVADRVLPLITAELHRAAAAFGRLATAHRDTPLAGRTLSQHAVPTTFGLKAAGWRNLVLDAVDRLTALRLPAQLGGAAGTLAAFEYLAEAPGSGPVLVERYAAELGLTAPLLPWHTLRTPVADLGIALAFTTAALGKPAADVLLLTRTETAELAEGSGGSSSAMPHKSNPVRATLVAAAARQAPALASVLLGSLTAEDERPAGAWHAEWQPLRQLLRLAGAAAHQTAELAEGLRVFPDRMLGNLHRTHGLVASERLAAALAGLLGRAEAKELLGRAARRVTGEETSLADVLTAHPALTGRITPERLRALADPATCTGAAPLLVDQALRRQSSAVTEGRP
ncbi:3-carboxy-cis,cis-muconate cycloisomerase [Streptomyces sp. NBC_01591]|uniref:3-carboxy-cis,cis-muconate cycloisomerase n=1 Tax=Streptomyces sp. NBC_01591 TaxID=2975888 RepID=UPI002DD7C1EF|nr:3-carboxy-cis,cis-muconate cycloisomerase [Streptomyces sp. NBC_01591]WSD72859.1 3-carboxy-cis,cis-muconate cycloisomerase [Streptomyces sp. NBC_01591]